jgi:hypothetical protein
MDDVPPEPKATFEDSTYSQLYSQISKDSGGSVKDAQTAQEIRKLLKGQTTTGTLKILPLLTSVLYVSEVARNHTAFHTNLMVLDLVEKGVRITGGSAFSYNLKNVLWQPQVIDSVMKLEQLDQQKVLLNSQLGTLSNRLNVLYEQRNRDGWLAKPLFNELRTKEAAVGSTERNIRQANTDAGQAKRNIGTAKAGMNELKSPGLTTSGGEASLPGGTAAMSHTGSAWGSAYDLEGTGSYSGVQGTSVFPKPSNAMTIVRRKEATILIRWLEAALKKDGVDAVAVAANQAQDTSGVYDRLNSLANSTTAIDDGMMKILPLLQKRVETFDCML